MKNWISFDFNKVFFCALLLLITINVIVPYSEDALLLQSTKALFIPIFLIFFFMKNKFLGIPFISFFLFSFLGDISVTFFESDMFIKASTVLYFLSYMCLLGVIISKFNFFKVDKVVGVYLLLIFLINGYFLYTLYGLLKAVVPDSVEVLLFGIKSVTLILLTFFAFGKYLNKDTKPSILFLLAVLCLVFSTVLNYVSMYYIYNWSFVMLERVIYAIGLYLFFNYIMEENKNQMIQKTFTSDAVFA